MFRQANSILWADIVFEPHWRRRPNQHSANHTDAHAHTHITQHPHLAPAQHASRSHMNHASAPCPMDAYAHAHAHAHMRIKGARMQACTRGRCVPPGMAPRCSTTAGGQQCPQPRPQVRLGCWPRAAAARPASAPATP
eukprot:365126-Chlamydomonas_euryale.AAC.12